MQRVSHQKENLSNEERTLNTVNIVLFFTCVHQELCYFSSKSLFIKSNVLFFTKKCVEGYSLDNTEAVSAISWDYTKKKRINKSFGHIETLYIPILYLRVFYCLSKTWANKTFQHIRIFRLKERENNDSAFYKLAKEYIVILNPARSALCSFT